jgi:hypothetical protein
MILPTMTSLRQLIYAQKFMHKFLKELVVPIWCGDINPGNILDVIKMTRVINLDKFATTLHLRWLCLKRRTTQKFGRVVAILVQRRT